jgi:hypothetical protein
MWLTPAERKGLMSLATLRRNESRQRVRLVRGLRSVAHRASTGTPTRRYEVLLCDRVAPLRSELLDVAAALERVDEPEPDTLRTLRWLLTDGCASPLYNKDVAEGLLETTLRRVQAELSTADPSALPVPDVLPSPHHPS